VADGDVWFRGEAGKRSACNREAGGAGARERGLYAEEGTEERGARQHGRNDATRSNHVRVIRTRNFSPGNGAREGDSDAG
jgi:hypothetical protein